MQNEEKGEVQLVAMCHSSAFFHCGGSSEQSGLSTTTNAKLEHWGDQRHSDQSRVQLSKGGENKCQNENINA